MTNEQVQDIVNSTNCISLKNKSVKKKLFSSWDYSFSCKITFPLFGKFVNFLCNFIFFDQFYTEINCIKKFQ